MNTYQSFLKTPNIVRYFIDRNEQDLSIVAIGYNDFHYLHPYPFFRTQNCYTVHIVLSGKGTLLYNGKSYEPRKNCIFILPNDTPFCYYPDKKEPWEYIFFEIHGPLLGQYATSLGFSTDSPVKEYLLSEKLLSQYRDFFRKTENQLPYSYYDAVSLLFQLLSFLAEQDQDGAYESRDNIIDKAKQFIKLKYLDYHFTIESIADSLHISHAQLCRLFKKQTGQTMISYLNDLKMAYAEKLLKESTLTATEICYAAGYKDYTYFLTVFKKRHGITTNEYREKIKR